MSDGVNYTSDEFHLWFKHGEAGEPAPLEEASATAHEAWLMGNADREANYTGGPI